MAAAAPGKESKPQLPDRLSPDPLRPRPPPPVTGGARLQIIFQNHFPKECLVISQKQIHLLKWASLGGQESMGGRSSKGYEIVVGEAGRAETPLPSGDDSQLCHRIPENPVGMKR